MAATAQVIWLSACVRYWAYRGDDFFHHYFHHLGDVK